MKWRLSNNFPYLAFLALALSLVFLSDPSFAQATAAALRESVSVPWGKWLSDILGWPPLATAAIAGLTWVLHRIGGSFLSAFLTDQVISDAVHLALAKTQGAVANETSQISVANEAAQKAFNWVNANEPKIASRLGALLGDRIVAKISQLGAGPSEAITVPTTVKFFAGAPAAAAA
jgi:hypothetical protein